MFYKYSQNNSGGGFYADERVQPRVFIEADSESEAETIADSLGIYFDGVEKGHDCECCGDRWSNYSDEVKPEDLEELLMDTEYGYDTVVHYANGKKRYLIHKQDFGFKNPLVSDTYFYMQPERKR